MQSDLLPTLDECGDAIRGRRSTALERFIYNHCPDLPELRHSWREELAAAILDGMPAEGINHG